MRKYRQLFGISFRVVAGIIFSQLAGNIANARKVRTPFAMIVSPASTDTLPELAWSIRDRAKLAVADEESGRNGAFVGIACNGSADGASHFVFGVAVAPANAAQQRGSSARQTVGRLYCRSRRAAVRSDRLGQIYCDHHQRADIPLQRQRLGRGHGPPCLPGSWRNRCCHASASCDGHRAGAANNRCNLWQTRRQRHFSTCQGERGLPQRAAQRPDTCRGWYC